MPANEPVNLTNCDREPIHIPGSIQPHGCLLACDAVAGRVLRHSENAAAMLGIGPDINGRNLSELLGATLAHDIRNALAGAPEATRPALLPGVRSESGRLFDMTVHRHAGHAIIEFEDPDETVHPLRLARELIGRIRTTSDTSQLLRQASVLLKAVLDYDRVMIYRFEHDGAGKVEAEAKRSDLESFLGQHFPASDIPQQARTLYLKNPIRIISNSRGGGVQIDPVLDPSGEPLDLSHAHLRSVSPVHLEYLRNMGVAASMSISIIVDQRLWGLIACHHYAPKVLTLPQRIAAELFGEFFSMHLVGLLQHRQLKAVAAARTALDQFLRKAGEAADVVDFMGEAMEDFRALLACDGIGLYMDDRWQGVGTTPPASAIPGLADFVATIGDRRIFATHQLSMIYPAADPFHAQVSGLLAIPLSKVSDDCLLFFRKERLQTLNWAGNPEKSYETGPLGDRLTPRKSFAIWKETVERQSEPWSQADREIATAIHSAAVEVVLRHSELMQDERQKAEVRQRLLNEELNHRVKNILAVIKSLVATPAKEATTLKDYIASLKGRIQALSLAHDQVIRGSGGGEIRRLLEAELSPFMSGSNPVTLEGPAVQLDGRAYAVAALVIHEMCTNAAKYGSLSVPGGKLSVRWTVLDKGEVELRWQEIGGPPVERPSRRGFGTALIDRSVPFELGGASTMEFDPGGLKATITLPARFATQLATRQDDAETSAASAAPSQGSRFEQASILLVEDQLLIAMDVEYMLAESGFGKIVVASSSANALEQLKSFTPDLALLDINLGIGTSVPVAEELVRRNVPFVFATGYDDRAALPEDLLTVAVVRKPYDSPELVAALSRCLAAA
jgi:light-regulated signal transduction histidine kinase (bacteriophytochrome)